MSFNIRLVITMVLCAGMAVAWGLVYPEPLPQEGELPVGVEVDANGETKLSLSEDGTKATDAESAESADGDSKVAKGELVETVLENDHIRVSLSNESGGLLRKIEPLKDQFQETDGSGLDFLGLKDEGSLEVGFVSDATDFSYGRPSHTPVLRQEGKRFVMRHQDGDVKVTQSVELLDGYEARLTVVVENKSSDEQRHRLRIRNRMAKGEDNRYDIHRSLCQVIEEGDSDVEYWDVGDVEDGSESLKGQVGWAAVDSKYFLHALVPTESGASCTTAMSESGLSLESEFQAQLVTLAGGEKKKYVFGLYLGAKEQDSLKGFSAVENAHLEDSVDWGWFGSFSKGLGSLMRELLVFFYNVTGVWGLAIVGLTIVVKGLTLPLTLKQMRSMKRMKEVKPQLDVIMAKYKGDRTKQQQEMQALYQREGVNPLAGCLPMVVQTPIWIALYGMLNATIDLYHQPFLWLGDLTKADPLFLLPVAIGGAMWFNTKLTPTAGDAQTQMVGKIMPALFAAFMLFMPAGLGVYIFTNIVLSLIQTMIQLRNKDPEVAAKAAAS